MRGAAALGLLPISRYVVGCGDGSGADGGGGIGPDGLPRYDYDGPTGPETMFEHGVASGDPLTDSVILWTRVSTDDDAEAEVFFEVCRDATFAERVLVGTEMTDAERDFTVKLDAAGLQPGTTYYYRFMCQGRISPIGRTRTAPEGDVSRLRFGVMSCANYAHGYFHGYRHAATRADLDAVLHLGDYIYEYGNGEYGDARDLQPPHEIVTLEDYRTRYAYYRKDPDTQAVHQQHPFITIWDDHEVTNDAWSGVAQNHMDDEGDYAERRAAAQRVYDEWMPIRHFTDGKIYRELAFGDLVDLVLLDTRHWARDQQSTDPDVMAAEDRQLLGADQEMWLSERVKASKASWCIIGQQIVMGQLKLGGAVLNPDGWDGYEAARRRLLGMLRDAGRGNFVVLAGDIHASAVNDLSEDPFDADLYDGQTREGAVAPEFVTPAITSIFPLDASFVQTVLDGSPHMRWANALDRGYMVLDVSAARVQADWYHYPDPENEDATVAYTTSFVVEDGKTYADEADAEATPPGGAPELAPV